MTLRNVGIAILMLIVLANIIAISVLPDTIVGLNLVLLVVMLAGIGYVYWRNQGKSKDRQ